MRFKDEHITVTCTLKHDDYRRCIDDEYEHNRFKRIAAAATTIAAVAVVIISTLCSDEDIVLTILNSLKLSIIAIIPGVYWYILSRREDPNQIPEATTTLNFCRNGFFTGSITRRRYFPYNSITRCKESTYMLTIEWKDEHKHEMITCIPARCLDAQTAQRIITLLREKCGKKYKFVNKLLPAELPENALRHCLTDTPPLYELEFTPTLQETERALELFGTQQARLLDNRLKVNRRIWLYVLALCLPFSIPAAISTALDGDMAMSIITAIVLLMCIIALVWNKHLIRREENQPVARKLTETQYGVRIALYKWSAIFRICGDEFIVHYTPAMTIEQAEDYAAIHLPEAYFGAFCAIPGRVLREHPQLLAMLSEKIPAGRTRVSTEQSQPLADDDGRGRELMRAQYGALTISVRRKSLVYRLIVNGKVYGKVRHSNNEPFFIHARVRGCRLALVCNSDNTMLDLYADRATLARTTCSLFVPGIKA